jgi:hypothetical protein
MQALKEVEEAPAAQQQNGFDLSLTHKATSSYTFPSESKSLIQRAGKIIPRSLDDRGVNLKSLDTVLLHGSH